MSPRPRQDPDGGFTLVELLVAMLVTGIVLTMVGVFFANTARLTTSARSARDAVGRAAIAVNAARSVISVAADVAVSDTATAPAVRAGGPTSVTVVSWANTSSSAPAPSLVVLSLDASGWLSQTTTVGSRDSSGIWTFTGASTTRRITGPFLTSAPTPFFSYLDDTGAVIASGSTALATGDLDDVAFVRVTAEADSRDFSGASSPVVVTTAIGLTDVGSDIDVGTVLPGLTGGR